MKEDKEKKRLRQLKYRREDREKHNRKQREYRHKNTDKAKAYKKRAKIGIKSCYLKKNYNIDIWEYNRMFEDQGGVCLICKEPERISNRSLSVDHCHKTGDVRGLLCSDHNALLGFAQDSILILESAIMYLQRSRQ